MGDVYPRVGLYTELYTLICSIIPLPTQEILNVAQTPYTSTLQRHGRYLLFSSYQDRRDLLITSASASSTSCIWQFVARAPAADIAELEGSSTVRQGRILSDFLSMDPATFKYCVSGCRLLINSHYLQLPDSVAL